MLKATANYSVTYMCSNCGECERFRTKLPEGWSESIGKTGSLEHLCNDCTRLKAQRDRA